MPATVVESKNYEVEEITTIRRVYKINSFEYEPETAVLNIQNFPSSSLVEEKLEKTITINPAS